MKKRAVSRKEPQLENAQNYEHPRWIKLDNAAKIYPAASTRNWTAIFRLSAELTEPIDPAILAEAQRATLRRFPSFSYRIRRGVFWYYLERVDGMPDIQQDVNNPCVRMDMKENQGFMFRVRYHNRRIALEIYHVLADGSGGISFLKTLVAEYLRLKYGADIPRDASILDTSAPVDNTEMEDAFARFSRGVSVSRREEAAYRIHGTALAPHYVNITTGMMPSDIVYEKAKERGGSVTEFLVAVLILAIADIQRKDVKKSRRNQPVKICVPVNLRKFYPTNTMRNFSSYINPGTYPSYGTYTLEEVIQAVKSYMALEGTEKKLNVRFSTNVKDEQNTFMRLVPLIIKNPTLKLAFKFNGDRTSSTTLSNLGVQKLPEEMQKYVTRLDFILGPLRYNPVTSACVSYNNLMCMNFTSRIAETDLERNFFTRLVKLGVPVTVESNRRY